MIYSLLYNHKKTAISDRVNLGTSYDQECHLKVTTECLTTSQSEQERQQMQIEADAKAQAKVEAKQEILSTSEESKQSDVIAKADYDNDKVTEKDDFFFDYYISHDSEKLRLIHDLLSNSEYKKHIARSYDPEIKALCDELKNEELVDQQRLSVLTDFIIQFQ